MNILGTMAAFIILVLVVGVGGFGLFTWLGGGSDKPNPGNRATSTANVNVEVNVNVPAAPAVDPAAQAMQAAIAARFAAEALYGQSYGQPVYGRPAAPELDQATFDRAVDAALQRRLELGQPERRAIR